ncbi:DUF2243 domain-containing protein [Leucobacter chromiiresistens]|uniref:Uncharacterized membrane protein n=1 Tax=Leucobacter chromiiresistens TaxID=1079994 RepID=A0A1H0XYD8_9MICO|nr:DUF2243 domain-containing protein [Leucobacter chromiiresistens]SDQ07897.1 Uncharacterized membrane protein [Leucobacter chromiiresistens]
MTRTSRRRTADPLRNRSYWAAFLLGVAAMAAIDEIVFHQILAWHHFYDAATPRIALLSDGLLHAAELFAFAFGFFLMLDARRRGTLWASAAWAGFATGLGLFQLWDGVVDHKVLRLHQIRYGVDLLPYDIAWNTAGGLLLVAGVIWTAVLARGGRDAKNARETRKSHYHDVT